MTFTSNTRTLTLEETLYLKLFNASKNGLIEELKDIFKSLEYNNLKNKEKFVNNALPLSCLFGQLDMVKYLLTDKSLKDIVHIDNVDNSKVSGLMYACKGGYLEIVEYLLYSPDLQQHADINLMDISGDVALIHATEFPLIVEYLLANKTIVVEDFTREYLPSRYDTYIKAHDIRNLHEKLDHTIVSNNLNNIKKPKI